LPGSILGGGPASSCGRTAFSGTGRLAVGTSCEIVTAGPVAGAANDVAAWTGAEPPAASVRAEDPAPCAIGVHGPSVACAGTSEATVTAVPVGVIATYGRGFSSAKIVPNAKTKIDTAPTCHVLMSVKTPHPART
jgi:hypothetical protein